MRFHPPVERPAYDRRSVCVDRQAEAGDVSVGTSASRESTSSEAAVPVTVGRVFAGESDGKQQQHGNSGKPGMRAIHDNTSIHYV